MSVWAPSHTRQASRHLYIRGGARGSTDQSEASILYPPEYLGRMPHVRGVVWGHPCSNARPLSLSLFLSRFFFPVVAFSVLRRDVYTQRHVNVLRPTECRHRYALPVRFFPRDDFTRSETNKRNDKGQSGQVKLCGRSARSRDFRTSVQVSVSFAGKGSTRHAESSCRGRLST